MSISDPSKEPLFGAGVSKFIALLMVLIVGSAAYLIITASDASAGGVIQPSEAPVQAAKVVTPKAPKVEDPPLVVQAPVEIALEEVTPQPDLITTTTLTIQRPDVAVPLPFKPSTKVVELLLGYFNEQGCTVIMAEPVGWTQSGFASIVKRSKCTLITVTQEVHEVLPDRPGIVASGS